MRIEPTVGRVVHYHPASDHPDHGQTLTALVCKVNPDGTINLAIFDSCGHQFSRQRVPLIQGDDEVCVGAQFCTWMPFQIGQAQKTEQVIRDTEHALMRHVSMEREARRAAFGECFMGDPAKAGHLEVITFDDLIDGASKAYDEAPVTKYNADLPPNTGWVRDARGDRPGDRFDENGVAIAEIPGRVVPTLSTDLAVSGDKPAIG